MKQLLLPLLSFIAARLYAAGIDAVRASFPTGPHRQPKLVPVRIQRELNVPSRRR